MKETKMPNNMRVIIVAAGLGSRLGSLTSDRPKCLLELDGKSILQHQLDVYNKANIADISVVIGYMKECFTIESVFYYKMTIIEKITFNSIFCAEEKFQVR